MNKKVIIIGAGGHAKVVADIIKLSGDLLVGFLDDNDSKINFTYENSPVLGKCSDYKKFKNDHFFIIGIGNNYIRKSISQSAVCNWYTAIHPSAQISPSAEIEEGTCVMANAVINSNAKIGRHSIINTASVIEHDCIISNYVHISPRSVVCGTTSIGDLVWLGAGSTVINSLTIHNNSIIGAGATVVKDINSPGTYVGTPAKRIIKTGESHE